MNKDLEQAKNLMRKRGYTCVILKDEQIYTSIERGVKPLLAWLDADMNLGGFSAADKVIGNGAAMLYVLLGVKEIYTPIISKAARQTLTEHGIEVYFDRCVDNIRNRTNTGNCPMEEAVHGINNPEEALQAIRRKLATLSTS